MIMKHKLHGPLVVYYDFNIRDDVVIKTKAVETLNYLNW